MNTPRSQTPRSPSAQLSGMPRPGTRLLLIAAALALIFGAVGALLAWRNERAEHNRATEQTAMLATGAAADVNDFFSSRIALLQSVALSPSVLGGNAPAITLYFEQVLANDPSLFALDWIDADGAVRIRVPSEPDALPQVSDRQYFQSVSQTLQPYISDALRSRVGNRWVVVVAVPVKDTVGGFAGVIAASVTLAELGQHLTTRGSGAPATLDVVDRAGQLLSRGADAEDVSGSPLLATARARGQGVEQDTSGVRGERDRVAAFAPVGSDGWLVITERPSADVYGPARRTLWATLVGLTATAALGIGGAAWAGRRLDRLAATERQASAEREESLALLDTLLANAPVGLGFFDPALRFVRLNDALAATNGLPAQAHIGRTVRDLLPGIPEEVSTDLRRVLTSGEPLIDMEVTGETPAAPGETRAWSASYYPVRTPTGVTLGLGAVVTEITERKRAEAERADLLAREQAARLAAERIAERIARSQAVTVAMSEALTSEAVADAVIEQGRAAVGARGAVVALLSDDGTTLRVLRAEGYPEDVVSAWREFPLSTAVPLAEAVRGGQSVLLSSREEAARRYPHLADVQRATDDHAWAALPLTVHGDVIGAMDLSFAQPRTFTADERAFLQTLAGQCAQALERARLFEAERAARAAAEDAQARLAFVAGASTVVSASLEYEATMGSVARLAIPLLADWCAIDAVTEDRTVRRVAMACADPDTETTLREMEQRYPPILESRRQIAVALQRGGSIVRERVTERDLTAMARDAEHLEMLRGLRVTSLMVVPMVARGRTLGALTMALAGGDRHYTPEDVALAEELARRAAVAADNALLYRQARAAVRLEQQRAAQLRGLADASLVINSALSMESLLATVTEQARAIIGAHQAATAVTRGGDWSRSVSAVSLSEKYAAWSAYTGAADGGGIYRIVADRNQPVRMTQDELESHPAWGNVGADAETHPPMRGWLAAPLVGRDGQNLGLIQLSDRYEGDFTAADEAALVQLAQLSSVAIENGRLTAELHESVRVRDEFLASVTHDLRSPLTSIKGFSQMLSRRLARDGVTDPTPFREGLQRIDAGTSRMMGLIDQLMDVARLQIGEPLDLSRRPTDLVALAQRSVDEYALLTTRHHIRVESELSDLLGIWDGPRLERVFVNLISNAVKYSPDGGEITLIVRRCSDASGNTWAEVAVQDHGIGIPAADIARVFDRFQRGTNVVGRISGSGIGLAGSRQIVEQHGGGITVQSVEGNGATFTVRLPFDVEDE